MCTARYYCFLRWRVHAHSAHVRLSTRTNTYLHTHIHTHKLKHTLLFPLCQFDTLFENKVWCWKLIVGVLWMIRFFFVFMKPKNPYSASRPGREVNDKRNAILLFPALIFSRQKSLLKLCTTQRSVVQKLFLKGKLGCWADTQPTNPACMSGKRN